MKYVGIALSDEKEICAYPETVFLKKENSIQKIHDLILKKSVQAVVMGESKDFGGNDNAIMPELMKYKTQLEKQTGLTVFLEPEFLTSHQASKLQETTDMIHASSAALILQSFLDRRAASKIVPGEEETQGRWLKDRP